MAKRLVCVLGGISFSVAAIFPVVNRPKSQLSHNETEKKKLKINEAIKQSRKLINRLKNEVGAPGIIVGVSVDGEDVWKEGFGYADIENEVEANEETVMRIASISKSLTAAVVARLWQDGVIDIDKPVQSYVPTFPEKKFENEKVTITTRHLMCHLSGIRHYSIKKKDESVASSDEFYSKERYDSVEKALAIFKDDDLLHAPGSKFLYTTYGWTLVSAVMEGATGKTYQQIMRAFLRELGMRRTYLDQHEPIIYGRSKCYSKNKNGRVVNSPYVDNSCKWAGGGFLSTVGDLLKFSNALLYAFQKDGDIEVAKGSYKMVSQKSLDSNTSLEEKNERADQSMVKISASVEAPNNIVSHDYSLAQKGLSNIPDKIISKKSNDSAESNEGSESALQKTTRAIGSSVGSITSAVISGASSAWNIGSSWITKDKDSESMEVDKSDDSAESNKGSDSALQKTTTAIGSSVGSIASGVISGTSAAWNFGSSWITKDKDAESMEVKKSDDSAESNKGSDSVLQKTTTAIGSSVGSITSGVISGTSAAWNFGSYLFSRDESSSPENNNNEDESQKSAKSGAAKSVLSLLSGLFSPKALDNDAEAVIVSDKVKEELSFPSHLTSKNFWNDIVIPYAVCAVSGQLSGMVDSQSESNEYEILVEIDKSPFFSRRLNVEPYILPATVAQLWTKVDGTLLSDWGPHVEGGYGLGFGVASPVDSAGGVIDGGQPYIVGHTGGAVGASSGMIIVPRKCDNSKPPKGIAVVLLCNMQAVSLNPLAIEIAKLFSHV